MGRILTEVVILICMLFYCVQVKHSDSYSTLMMSRLSRQDCGTYMCKVHNSAGISWQTIRVSQVNKSSSGL